MASTASFKGHPLHPILIPLPIGLWIFSIVSDLIFKFGFGGPVWNEVAFYTLGGGIVGALIAALPGFIDLTDLQNPKTKTIAIWHMTINLLAVALYCVNFWLRMQRAPARGRACLRARRRGKAATRLEYLIPRLLIDICEIDVTIFSNER